MGNYAVASLTVIAGSLDAWLHPDAPLLVALDGADVVVLPTAAAFQGPVEAVVAVHEALTAAGATVEGLMVTDRAGAREAYFARRVSEADVVVTLDGAPLHARSVWRGSPVGESLAAASTVVALGATASVLGATMIDPRGGAPTTGLGRFDDLVVGLRTDDEQDRRTYSLLGDLVVALLDEQGVISHDATGWSVRRSGVWVTRAGEPAGL
jgi:cyanophycinase